MVLLLSPCVQISVDYGFPAPSVSTLDIKILRRLKGMGWGGGGGGGGGNKGAVVFFVPSVCCMDVIYTQ